MSKDLLYLTEDEAFEADKAQVVKDIALLWHKDEACAAFDVFENPNVLCLIEDEVFEEEKIKLSKKSPYFNPKMNHVQLSTTLTFSVIDEFVHIW